MSSPNQIRTVVRCAQDHGVEIEWAHKLLFIKDDQDSVTTVFEDREFATWGLSLDVMDCIASLELRHLALKQRIIHTSIVQVQH
jgi:hypothetical protein